MRELEADSILYNRASAIARSDAVLLMQSWEAAAAAHLEGDDVGAPRGGARQLDGVVHNLAAAVCEEEAIEALRHDAVQAVDEPDLRRRVPECVTLRLASGYGLAPSILIILALQPVLRCRADVVQAGETVVCHKLVVIRSSQMLRRAVR